MRPQCIGGTVVLVTTWFLQLQWYTCTCLGNIKSTVYTQGNEGILCTPFSQDFGETATLISCATKCDLQPWCVGVFHNNLSRSCYGVDATSTDSCSSADVDPAYRFYRNSALKTSTAGLKQITTADPTCVTDEDCTPAFPHTDCRQDGVCTCVAGFSFIPDSNTCVTTLKTSTAGLKKITTADPTCVTDVDCSPAFPHTDCRQDGACTCVAGFSFVPATNTCVTSCPEGYGNTFTPTTGFSLAGLYVWVPDMSRDDCFTECRGISSCASISVLESSDGSTDCLWYDWDHIVNTWEWTYDPDHVYYQRNCA